MDLKVNMLALPAPPQLGFFQIASGIAALITSGANAYTTIMTVDIAKDQAKAAQKLAEQKAGLEAELIQTQKRIFDIQAEGLEARNDIDLQVAQAQADSLERQLKRANELEEMQLELGKVGIAIDYEKALMKLNELENEEKTIVENIQSFGMGKIAISVGIAVILGVLVLKGR